MEETEGDRQVVAGDSAGGSTGGRGVRRAAAEVTKSGITRKKMVDCTKCTCKVYMHAS